MGVPLGKEMFGRGGRRDLGTRLSEAIDGCVDAGGEEDASCLGGRGRLSGFDGRTEEEGDGVPF